MRTKRKEVKRVRTKMMGFAAEEELRQTIRRLAFEAEMTPSTYLYRLVKEALRRGVRVPKEAKGRKGGTE